MLPQTAFRDIADPQPLTSVRIEASSVCQLGCPVCPTASGARRKTLGWGHLDPEKFRLFLEKNLAVKHVELSHFGEIFLNPRLVDILTIGAERGIELTAVNGVNLNHATDAQLEALVKYRFRYLNVAIDGITPETYARYRRKGSLHRVLENVQKITQLKKTYGSPFPELEWQMVVFGHNQDELPAAQSMAHDLGMTFYPKQNLDPTYSPVRNVGKIRRLCREIIAGEAYSSKKVFDDLDILGICRGMWQFPQFNWDGRLLGCCVNTDPIFGNAFEIPLIDLVKEENYRYAQGMLLGQNPPRPGIPCTNCPIYRSRVYPFYAFRFLKVTDSFLMRFAAVALIQNAVRIKTAIRLRVFSPKPEKPS